MLPFGVSGLDSPPSSFGSFVHEVVVGGSCSSCRLEKDPHKVRQGE